MNQHVMTYEKNLNLLFRKRKGMKHQLIHQRETEWGSEVRPSKVEIWANRKRAPNFWVEEKNASQL